MRFGRRYWAIVGVGVCLAALAVLLARPVLLVGAAGLGAWLCARQLQFVRTLVRTRETMTVTQAYPARIQVGHEVAVRFDASLSRPTPLTVEIEATPPVVAQGSSTAERTIRLDSNIRNVETVFTVEWPVAGTFEFDPAAITATSRDGLFSERLFSGRSASVIVEPPEPTNVHVGEAGDRISTAFGEHDSGRLGSGLDPAELRAYVPGDAASRIDWKATARLSGLYVREHEPTTNRKTVLLVDHRAALDVGHDGRTKLEYLRQVALSLVPVADDATDPLGLYAVGDEGVTAQLAPQTTDDQFTAVRQRLHDLSPTQPADAPPSAARSPASARRTARSLSSGDGDFETTLFPYVDATNPYVARVERDPLVETVRTSLSRLDGSAWIVLLTDDTDRVQVREAVKLARRGDRYVTVFLTPSALFESGGFGDLDAAYERYASFEQFRRDLAGLERVSAFEVGPGDRIDTLLSHRRRQIQPSTP